MASPRPRLRSLRARRGTLRERAARLRGEFLFEFRRFNRAANRLVQALDLTRKEARESFTALVVRIFNAMQVGDPSMGLPGTPIDLGTARAGWTFEKVGDDETELRFRFANNVEYIVFLEFGHSQQAPQGFVRITLRRFTRELRTVVRELASGR